MLLLLTCTASRCPRPAANISAVAPTTATPWFADTRGSTLMRPPQKELMIFDRLGKKVRPGTLGKIKAGYRECPKSPSANKNYKLQ